MSDSTWLQQLDAPQVQTHSPAQATPLPILLQYAAAFALLSVFRLGGLTHQSLWFDEGYTLNLVSVDSFHSFLDLFGSYTSSEHLQPLYYFLMFGWTRIAGLSDVALRLPSALFSIGSGLCLYAMLRLLATRAAGARALLGIGVFSMSSYSVYYAQEARPYACIQFFSFLVLLAWLLQSREQRSQGSATAGANVRLAIACAFACLSSVFGALLVFCLAAADLYRLRREAKVWRAGWRYSICSSATVLSTYAIFAALRFPSVVAKDIVSLKQPLWMNAAYAVFGTIFGTTIGPSTLDLRGGGKLAVLLHATPVLVPAGLIVLALAWAVTQIAARSVVVPYTTRVFGLAALIYGALLFGCFGMVGKLNILPRHASALFALGVLAIAQCVLSRSARDLRVPHRVLVLSLVGAFVLNCVSVFRSIYAAQCRKDDYRAVAAALPHDGEPVFLTAGHPSLLQHYGSSVASAEDVNPAQLATYLTGASGAAEHIHVVTNTFRNYRWDGAPSVASMLRPAYACHEENHFAYFQVLACALRPDGPDALPPNMQAARLTDHGTGAALAR